MNSKYTEVQTELYKTSEQRKSTHLQRDKQLYGGVSPSDYSCGFGVNAYGNKMLTFTQDPVCFLSYLPIIEEKAKIVQILYICKILWL